MNAIWLPLISSLLLAFSAFGILLLCVFNPMLLWLMSLLRPKPFRRDPQHQPSVTFITVFHDAEASIEDKVRNYLDLDYPEDKLNFIFYEDGATEHAQQAISPFLCDRIRFDAAPAHQGKNRGLNAAVEMADGEILAFSDMDARLEAASLRELVASFVDPGVGGVCGNMHLLREGRSLEEGQRSHLRFDHAVRILENRTGSLTSNTGTLHAVRRKLWQPIDPGATDDLYTCLSVVDQGQRFVFEPRARVWVYPSSRDTVHEIRRRCRIVSSSLRGIWRRRAVLNPARTGFYAFNLFVNKIVRRLLPVFGLVFFFSTASLAYHSRYILILFLLQIAAAGLALSHLLVGSSPRVPAIFKRLASSAWYFCVGNWGVLMGLWYLLRRKRVEKWNAAGKVV